MALREFDRALSRKSPLKRVIATVPCGAAVRLRQISGLELGRLAAIVGVSRMAYHKWLSGSTPRAQHREHLLEVLRLIEEAAQRLGSQSTLTDWLLTPVSSDENTPIDYLAAREYQAFRGFLLRAPTDRRFIRPPVVASRVRRERPQEEVAEALSRLGQRVWTEDDDPRHRREALPDSVVLAVQKPIVDGLNRLRDGDPMDAVLDAVGKLLFLLHSDAPPYEVEMWFIRDERAGRAPLSDVGAAKLAAWIDSLLGCGGNARLVHWDVYSLRQISVYDYTNAYELRLDHYSLP